MATYAVIISGGQLSVLVGALASINVANQHQARLLLDYYC